MTKTITTDIEGVEFADESTEFLFQVKEMQSGKFFGIWVTHNKVEHWFPAVVSSKRRNIYLDISRWLNEGDFTFYQGSFIRFNSIHAYGEILGADGKTHYTDSFEDPQKAITEAKAIADRIAAKKQLVTVA